MRRLHAGKVDVLNRGGLTGAEASISLMTA